MSTKHILQFHGCGSVQTSLQIFITILICCHFNYLKQTEKNKPFLTAGLKRIICNLGPEYVNQKTSSKLNIIMKHKKKKKKKKKKW